MQEERYRPNETASKYISHDYSPAGIIRVEEFMVRAFIEFDAFCIVLSLFLLPTDARENWHNRDARIRLRRNIGRYVQPVNTGLGARTTDDAVSRRVVISLCMDSVIDSVAMLVLRAK